jgi:hypothetical protein
MPGAFVVGEVSYMLRGLRSALPAHAGAFGDWISCSQNPLVHIPERNARRSCRVCCSQISEHQPRGLPDLGEHGQRLSPRSARW